MPSSLTAYDPIPENSAATPGLWDSRFSTLQQNILQVQGGVAGTSSNTLTAESGNTIFANSSVFSVNTLSAVALAGALQHALSFGAHFSNGAYNNSAPVTVTTDATALNTASALVQRDSSGNFAAGTITVTSLTMPNVTLTNTDANDTNSLVITQSEASHAAAVIVVNDDNTAGGRVIAGLYAKALDGAGGYYSGSVHTYGSNYNVAAFRGHTIVSNDAGLGMIVRSIHATTAHIDFLVGSTGAYGDLVAQMTPTGITMSSGMTIAAQAVTATTVIATQSVTATINTNAGNWGLISSNTNTGSNAVAGAYLQSDSGYLTFRMTSAAHTLAGAGQIESDSSGGLSLVASHASGDVRIYSRNALAVTFGASQKALFAGEVELDGALNHDGTTVGFYGVAPTTRQVLATGAGATVDNVITALQTLGLVSQT